MKNYYELLEVSEKASPEVIKKAYTTLVKKYHPDLQPDSEKKAAEEKIKEINEAYEILSDKTKRENYNNELERERIKQNKKNYSTNQVNNNNNTSKNQQKKIIRTPHIQNDDDDDFSDFAQFQQDYNNIMNEVYNNAYNQAYNNAYNQAYINNLKNMGYDIQFERSFKEKVKLVISVIIGILIVIFIGFILWQIPPIKHYFITLYNTNTLFKILVDLLFNVFNSFINIFKK